MNSLSRQAKLAGAKAKRAQMERDRLELMAKEVAEQEVRRDLLQKAVNLFQSTCLIRQFYREYFLYQKDDTEIYGLPDGARSASPTLQLFHAPFESVKKLGRSVVPIVRGIIKL